MQNQKKTYESDYAFGKRRELECLKPIGEYFGKELKATTKQYAHYDYKCRGTRIELKSRRNTRCRYPTTLIGKSKVDHAKNYEGKSYFVFDFTDGLYYIRYREKVFKDFSVTIRGRNDRGSDEFNEYVEIPVHLLKKME